jgi:adenine deaminase
MTDRVDYLLRGTLVKVTTGNLVERPVAVRNDEIVALEERPAERELEAAYIAPGLIDAHMHVESSMVTLPRYGRAVVPEGVTAIIYDPHEVANVLGEDGVRAMLRDGRHTPLKARCTVPSSVPASHLQDGGATVDTGTVGQLLDEPDVAALGEVMNIPGLLAGDEGIHDKIQAARERGLTVDGHMPQVRGSDLQEVARYLDNDHESTELAEAREKVEAGVRVYLREGTCSRDLSALLGLADKVDSRRLSLCTDDRSVADLVEVGGIDSVVRLAIAGGVDPVEAVQMATINTAEAYGLPFGRVAPGAPAHLVLLSDLRSWDVEHVMIDGVLDPTTDVEEPPPTAIATDTVTFDPVEAADLTIGHDGPGPVTVRVVDAVGTLQTARMRAEVPVLQGAGSPRDRPVLGPNRDEDVLHMAVIERHGGDGGIGRGFVHGMEMERGAVAATVAHDAHNCVVVGADFEAMARAANHIRDIEGGLVAYDPRADGDADGEGDDNGFTALALPVAGLMRDAPLAEVKARHEAVTERARALGVDRDGWATTLSFLALEVIPEYRLTNNGLVDVEAFDYVDVVVGN